MVLKILPDVNLKTGLKKKQAVSIGIISALVIVLLSSTACFLVPYLAIRIGLIVLGVVIPMLLLPWFYSYTEEFKKSFDKTYLVVVPNKKEVKRGTLISILKQAGMSRERFFELLEKK